MTDTIQTIETRLCMLADIPEEDGLQIKLPGRQPLAVWRVGDEAYVTDDTCTHGQASLTEGGAQDEFVIECGLHLGAFDIRDGCVVSVPCTLPLRVYLTFVRDGTVFAKLPIEKDTTQ